MSGMSSKPTPTPGPCDVQPAEYGFDIFTRLFDERPPQWIATVHTPAGAMNERERLGMYPDTPTCKANADLIAEAFTVHHETGLTPQQLREQRDKAIGVLRSFVAKIDPAILVEKDAPSAELADELRDALGFIASVEAAP